MAERPSLPALTGLRFIAAAQVVLFHLRDAAPGLKTSIWLAPFGGGYSGVSLFFVLSGFVLAYNYLSPNGAGVRSVRSFLAARAARIYPVYLLGVLIGLPVFVAELMRQGGVPEHFGFFSGVVAANLTLTQAWVPDYACQLNCPGWSLSVEAFFYLLFPLIGWWLCRRRTVPLLLLSLGCLGLSYAAALGYMTLDPDGLGTAVVASNATWLSVLKFNPVARLPEFVLGMALGLLFLRAPNAFGSSAGPASLLACAISFIALAAHDRLPYPLLHNGLLAPIYCVLIFTLASGAGPLARLLSTRLLRQLGEASFALYLLHLPLIGYCARALAPFGITQTDAWTWSVMYLVVCQLSALVVLHWVEEPFRARIRRWLAPALTIA